MYHLLRNTLAYTDLRASPHLDVPDAFLPTLISIHFLYMPNRITHYCIRLSLWVIEVLILALVAIGISRIVALGTFMYNTFVPLFVMAYNPAEKAPLSVSPDREGIKRRQAEFLLLHYLGEQEVASKEKLKSAVKNHAKIIAQRGGEPPVYFNSTAGRAAYRDREFNEILDRCLHRGWIEHTIDDKYGITDKGTDRVSKLESNSQYKINREFKNLLA